VTQDVCVSLDSAAKKLTTVDSGYIMLKSNR
jgi:hypothetical protein